MINQGHSTDFHVLQKAAMHDNLATNYHILSLKQLEDSGSVGSNLRFGSFKVEDYKEPNGNYDIISQYAELAKCELLAYAAQSRTPSYFLVRHIAVRRVFPR